MLKSVTIYCQSYNLNDERTREFVHKELDQGHKSYIPCSFDTNLCPFGDDKTPWVKMGKRRVWIGNTTSLCLFSLVFVCFFRVRKLEKDGRKCHNYATKWTYI